MSIADEITRLTNAKAAIRSSIIRKGVLVDYNAKLDEYPALINAIPVTTGSSYEDIWNQVTNNNTDYSYIFAHGDYGLDLDISTLNIDNVWTMESMFYYSQINSLTIGSGYNHTLNNTSYMFYECSSLTSLDLSNWTITNIITAPCMFQGCSNLTEINLTNWNTSQMTFADSMFDKCLNLQTITGELNLSNLYEGARSMFYNCPSLYWVELKNIYSNCSMDNDNKWTIDLGDTYISDDCLRNIIYELPDLYNDKGLSETDQIMLVLPTSNGLYDYDVQPAIDKGWSVANTNF